MAKNNKIDAALSNIDAFLRDYDTLAEGEFTVEMVLDLNPNMNPRTVRERLSNAVRVKKTLTRREVTINGKKRFAYKPSKPG